jgi:hypothetical protein
MAGALPQADVPMIIRTAYIRLLTGEFSEARQKMGETVSQLQGYIDDLTVKSEPETEAVLLANLRSPANRMESAVAEFKRLGRLIDESQSDKEVTNTYGDLGSRLSNAQTTERRLLNLLEQRTGNLGEVVQVEKEIGRIREQIETMEAENKRLETQVQFASIQLELVEDIHAQFSLSLPGSRARLRSAVIRGYQSALQNTVELVLFVLLYSPTLLLWSVFVVPFIFAWRRLHARTG